MTGRDQISPEGLYDVIIIGAGPAGLTAALYLARARCRVLVIEKGYFGGQIAITSEVVNYPGIQSTSGAELTETMRRQAQDFGTEFLLAEATGLDMTGDVKTVRTSEGDRWAFGVLLAAGARPRRAGFAGEEAYLGRGVSYCATCDGAFFTGKDVFVVGGGFAAAEESVFLTRFARHVTVLIRGEDFSCARAVAERARTHEKITVLTHTVVEGVSGEQGIQWIRCRDTKTGEGLEWHTREGETFGVFVFAGYEPVTGLVRGLARLDDRGYVLTDRSQKTSVDGLYAAGDVCAKGLRQVVTAVGDGALAAAALEQHAAAGREKTGLRPLSGGLPGGEEAGEMGGGESRAGPDSRPAPAERPVVLRLPSDSRPTAAELERCWGSLAALGDRMRKEVAAARRPDRPGGGAESAARDR